MDNKKDKHFYSPSLLDLYLDEQRRKNEIVDALLDLWTPRRYRWYQNRELIVAFCTVALIVTLMFFAGVVFLT